MLNFPLNSAYFFVISIFLLEKSILTLILELNIVHTTTTVALFSTVSACTEAFAVLLQALWSRAWAWLESVSVIWLRQDSSLVIIIYLKLIWNYVFFINAEYFFTTLLFFRLFDCGWQNNLNLLLVSFSHLFKIVLLVILLITATFHHPAVVISWINHWLLFSLLLYFSLSF